MLAALREGISGYQPFFRGEPLAVETGVHTASLTNLRVMRKAGCQPVSMQATGGNVLFVFKGGEEYLATGFAVGYEGEEVMALAVIASEFFGGETDHWFDYLAVLPMDWDDLLELPPGIQELAVFSGEEIEM
jgi:hypothetical protein